MKKIIDIRDIKYNQVITVELKNGQSLTGHFRGVSKLINNEYSHITNRKIVNLAKTTTDSIQPEASILNNIAVNASQVIRYSVNEEYADKVNK